MTRISVVGLGKLGACMAASFAYKGHGVVGVDVDPATVSALNSGQPPVSEPGLAEIIAQANGRLRATGDYNEAIRDSDVTFIVVPTPSEDHGGFSLRYVKQAAREIGRALRKKASYHLVALTSTVLPGSSEYGVVPVLEDESGKKCGHDFGFCYSPEFIALGSVIRDLLNPDFVLIGEWDKRSGDRLAPVLEQVCENSPPVIRLSLINSELAKISINSYVTMKITFANMIAALCEQLPGGDVDQVTKALGLDKRIGPHYLRGALGFGGPCFPRDNLALAYLADQLGLAAPLPRATDEFNRGIVDTLAERVASSISAGGTIAVLGLAYKPDTNVVEESQGLQLAQRLAQRGLSTIVYDPKATREARGVLGDSVSYAESLKDCIQRADLLVIATPDKEFSNIQTGEMQLRPGQMVFDSWRILRTKFENNGHASYRALGLGGDLISSLAARLKKLWGESLKQAV